VIPDGEHIVYEYEYLRDHDSVSALGARIVGMSPKDPDSTPWVGITQLAAPNQTGAHVDHLIGFLLQFDCYASRAGTGGSQWAEAKLLARTVRAALMDMPEAEVADVVVASCRIVGDIRRPDTDLEPARERVILTAPIGMHS